MLVTVAKAAPVGLQAPGYALRHTALSHKKRERIALRRVKFQRLPSNSVNSLEGSFLAGKPALRAQRGLCTALVPKNSIALPKPGPILVTNKRYESRH